MAKTKKTLGEKQFKYWKKHGFDNTFREALNWTEAEYKTYNWTHLKKIPKHAGKSPRKDILKKAAKVAATKSKKGVKPAMVHKTCRYRPGTVALHEI